MKLKKFIFKSVNSTNDKAIKITDVNELGDVMISQLSSLFETKKKFH